MAILDLGKTIIKPQIEGAACPNCGGELIPSKIKNITGKIIKAMSLGKINMHNFKCKNCEKTFYLF